MNRGDVFSQDFETFLAERRMRQAGRQRNPRLEMLEREQIAAQLGESDQDEKHKYVTKPECYMSFGKDDKGNPKGPWHRADAQQFAEAQKIRPKNDPNYNLVRDPRDGRHKIYRTRDGGYCVRDQPVSGKLPDLLKTVERIEKIAKVLKIGRQDKQKQLQQEWREKSNRRLADFDRLMRISKHGHKVDFEPSTENICGMGGENGQAWNEQFGPPTNPNVGGLEPSTYEKVQAKQWYRPWYIDEGGDSEPFCAADDSDLPLKYPETYHGLGGLRNVPEGDKPRTTQGGTQPDGKIYRDAMFCAQQQREKMCTDPTLKKVPLGGKDSPANVCAWYPQGDDGGTCMPRYVYRKRTPGTRKPYGPDALSQWYKQFQKEEEQLLNSRGMFSPPSSGKSGRRFTGLTKEQAMWKEWSDSP